jgi:hypothetical protein
MNQRMMEAYSKIDFNMYNRTQIFDDGGTKIYREKLAERLNAFIINYKASTRKIMVSDTSLIISNHNS